MPPMDTTVVCVCVCVQPLLGNNLNWLATPSFKTKMEKKCFRKLSPMDTLKWKRKKRRGKVGTTKDEGL